MQHRLTTHFFLTLLLLCAATARGEVLVSEPFDYRDGAVTGNDAVQWASGAWQHTDGQVVFSEGALAVSGNDTLLCPLDKPVSAASPLYLAVRARVDGLSPGSGLRIGLTNTDGSDKLCALQWIGDQVSFVHAGSPGRGATSVPQGRWNTLLLEWQVSDGTSKIRFWVNPEPFSDDHPNVTDTFRTNGASTADVLFAGSWKVHGSALALIDGVAIATDPVEALEALGPAPDQDGGAAAAAAPTIDADQPILPNGKVFSVPKTIPEMKMTPLQSLSWNPAETRRAALSLNGTWQVGEGMLEACPEDFEATVPVPGLMSQAEPGFPEVGGVSKLREAFWYRTAFTLDGPAPEAALLKLHKAMYCPVVYLNGQQVGLNYSFSTPVQARVESLLHTDGRPNELVVCVAADQSLIPRDHVDGGCMEKEFFFPGIYDDVELILSGLPRVRNIQTAPDLENEQLRVQAEIAAPEDRDREALAYTVTEATSGKAVATGQATASREGDILLADFRIDLPDARLWSPDDPFLYRLTLETEGDTASTRFGMRSFAFDPQNKRAVFNGEPHYIRGTNICLQRFFNDSTCEDLPWDREWVRELMLQMKAMNWDFFRFHLGFAPDFWYDIADEVGLMVADEYPIWGIHKSRFPYVTGEKLAEDYTLWMRERWNHPSVVLWDAQNETKGTPQTGEAIELVRHLDLSDRPWDNGWSAPQHPNDPMESHPYISAKVRPQFIHDKDLHWHLYEPELLGKLSGKPRVMPDHEGHDNTFINNEYGWFWLNRNGDPTQCTREIYDRLIPGATEAERREFYARTIAMLTEYWRSTRNFAGVQHFSILSYSYPADHPKCYTSDHFLDVREQKLDPYFVEYVPDSFAPVGVMIDEFRREIPDGPLGVDVAVVNDLGMTWEAPLELRLMDGDKVVETLEQPCRVEPYGRSVVSFDITIPAGLGNPELVAGYRQGDDRVTSRRKFQITSE